MGKLAMTIINTQRKRLRTALLYLCIIAVGVAIGYAAPRFEQWLKPAYVEGNYADFFPNKQIQVVVYGSATCTFCAKTRDYFQQNRIAFSDVDVANTDMSKEKLAQIGIESVPVVLIGNRKIRGFHPDQFEAALKLLTQNSRS
jgi:mycoredoxin